MPLTSFVQPGAAFTRGKTPTELSPPRVTEARLRASSHSDLRLLERNEAGLPSDEWPKPVRKGSGGLVGGWGGCIESGLAPGDRKLPLILIQARGSRRQPAHLVGVPRPPGLGRWKSLVQGQGDSHQQVTWPEADGAHGRTGPGSGLHSDSQECLPSGARGYASPGCPGLSAVIRGNLMKINSLSARAD